ncbi:MAG: outer membrane beta-barrel protein [Lachnospiraceae bacterium]
MISRSRIITILLFTVVYIKGYSQELTGVVKDSVGNPVDFATVVLQKTDSMHIGAVLTDTAGIFVFQSRPAGKLRLIVQHLNYFSNEIEIQSATFNIGTVILTEKPTTLKEVTVTAERPQVVIKDGALSYSVAFLTKNRATSTAFEVVKEIPGVSGSSEEIELIGAGAVNIVLNGKISTMSRQQVYNLLRSIPASRVKDVEIMYNAPARYNVNGALINVITDNKESGGQNIQGEVTSEYKQSHYASGSLTGNLIYQTSKFSIDIMADAGKGKTWKKDELYSRQTTANGLLELNQYTRTKSNFNDYKFRFGAEYTLKNKDNLSFSYYFDGSNRNAETNADNNFVEMGKPDTRSVDNGDGSNEIHNARFQYSGHKGLNAGIDFTYYRSPDNSHFSEYTDDTRINNYINNSLQKNYRWMLFANNTNKLSTKWSLNYGINGGYNQSDNSIEYLFPQSDGPYIPNPIMDINNNQKEYTGNVFAGITGKFNNKLSLTASLKTEYFRSDYELNSIKSTLWNEWSLFPTVTMRYNISPKGMAQFNLLSSKSYPSYWAVSPQTTQVNSYTFIVGNPELKPSRMYRGQILYIFNRKYIFMAFANYSPDAFQQLPYQDENMTTIYRFENLDFALNTGLAVIVPFNVGFWNTRITVQGFRIEEKMSDFHGKSFDNIGFAGVVMSNNTFILSKDKPNLILQIDGRYQSPSIQGIYKLEAAYGLSSAIKWTFTNGSYLSLRYNNILQHQTPRPITVDWEGQYSRRINKDYSTIVVTFAWRFGKYKEKTYEKVDNSRFGR